MEAAIVNDTSDRVLVANSGVFGDRFVKIATKFGPDVEAMNIPW